jgi:hypothetical protein
MMRTGRLFFLLLILAAGVALGALPVLAQDFAACSYLVPAKSALSALGSSTFNDCAAAIWSSGRQGGNTSAAGMWGMLLVYVDQNGNVYYANNAQNPNWTYWTTLSRGAAIPQQGGQGQATPAPLTFGELIDLGIEDINDYWSGVFAENNMEYVRAGTVLFNRSRASTACGVMPSSAGPFYCFSDMTIYMPDRFMRGQHGEIGDYAAVTIIAHEWGHHIQNLAGMRGSRYTIQIELQADCFAGAYAEYVATRSRRAILEAGDIEEGVTSLFYAGDPMGTPWFDEQAHGTGDQRMQAFQTGYQGGYQACLNLG